MKAREIFEHLLSQALSVMSPTCDTLICGDPEKEVRLAATCFKLTAETLDKAIALGVDMIITHEPTFAITDNPEDATFSDIRKWETLKNSGITVYRFHDHAHHRACDYIHQGFIDDTRLKIFQKYPAESMGIARYDLEEPMTARKLANIIKEQLDLDVVKIVGCDDAKIKTVCLGLGGVGFKQIQYLFDPGCDTFITGEVPEVKVCEYVRDSAYYGENKSIIILGHYSAEFSGMRLLAKELDNGTVKCVYLDSKEVFKTV